MQRFGVNLIPAATDRALLDAQVLACIELGVPVMGLFWDVPLPLAQRLRDAEIIVVCQVGSLAEARAAEHAGAQVLIVQGLEAGGHVRGDAPLDKLLSAIAEQTGVPVLAAGGFADGADLATVMSLGAQGGVFGTVLIATPESFAHDYHKQRLVDADGEETVLTDAFHINWPRVAKARVLANSVTRGERGDPFSEARTIIGDELGRPIYQFNTDSPLRAMTGTLEAMALYAGTGVGRITDIVGAADRVRAIAAEAARLLDANATPPSERADLASPACLAHEMDDRYMRFASREDLLPALNELLEAERAGVRVTLRTAAELSDELKPFVMAIHRDDARWCGGAHPSGPAIGRRALAEDWSVPRQGDGDGGHPGPARLSQSRPRLGRAQAQGAASDHPHEAVHTDLAAMLASHESNIELVTAQLPMTTHIGTSHER